MRRHFVRSGCVAACVLTAAAFAAPRVRGQASAQAGSNAPAFEVASITRDNDVQGRWDAQIDFVPTFVAGPTADAAPVPNPAADTGPGMLSAMKDQLGLRLQAGKAGAEFLVIDYVERPTAD